MSRRRNIAELPPIPAENVIYDVRSEIMQVKRALETFLFDMEVTAGVVEHDERAHPTWKHTHMAAALGRYGEFNGLDVTTYMEARIERLKARLHKVLKAVRKQEGDYETQRVHRMRPPSKLIEERPEEWR